MGAAEIVSNLLKHHGIKGMKWGVRRDRPSAVSVSDKGKKLTSKGGFGHPAHPEAVRARTSGQIAKKSGVKALSDQQLRDYSNRLRLEQEVKRLQYNEKPAAHRFILKALGRSGNQAIDKHANAENAKKVGVFIAAKRAAKVAAVAAA